eukprot:TRINITY_DN9463_c0_g1_i1.p1 TRINITY_DN9463_c0_g1~~TRINITY_DN9463_c0_g1_i1.p1  ORF type:complete len:327 (+),score=56.38 TRINITY_DN9463_c0_g1_i1:136-1116(+)
MRSLAEWGDDMEICAIAKALKINIVIHSSVYGSLTKTWNQTAESVRTDRRAHVAYDGSHYESVWPKGCSKPDYSRNFKYEPCDTLVSAEELQKKVQVSRESKDKGRGPGHSNLPPIEIEKVSPPSLNHEKNTQNQAKPTRHQSGPKESKKSTKTNNEVPPKQETKQNSPPHKADVTRSSPPANCHNQQRMIEERLLRMDILDSKSSSSKNSKEKPARGGLYSNNGYMPPEWLLSRSSPIEWVIYSPKKDKQEESNSNQPKNATSSNKPNQSSKRGNGRRQAKAPTDKWKQRTLPVFYKEQSSGGGSASEQGSSGQRAPEAQTAKKN